MSTKPNAHVCTPCLVPILGQIEDDEFMLGHSSAKPKGINSCDPWHGPDKEDWLRRRKAAEANRPPTNWPGQRFKELPPIPRTHDATAELHQSHSLSDCYHYETDDGLLAAAAHRHDSKHRQKWTCWLFIRDSSGAEWNRDFPAVTDDFGWLVEVPAC
nr:hypothetical protein [uncultured Comamonas sp.]